MRADIIRDLDTASPPNGRAWLAAALRVKDAETTFRVACDCPTCPAEAIRGRRDAYRDALLALAALCVAEVERVTVPEKVADNTHRGNGY